MAKMFFIPGVYLELMRLRENSYSLKLFVRTFAVSGLVLSNAFATYLKKLAIPREQLLFNTARIGNVAASTVQLQTKRFQMKADIPRQERRTYMTSEFFIPSCSKGNEPQPQPEMCAMVELVLDVYPELKRLRENSYSRNVLVRSFAASDLVLSNALATYMKKLAIPREQLLSNEARTGKLRRQPFNCGRNIFKRRRTYRFNKGASMSRVFFVTGSKGRFVSERNSSTQRA